MNNINNDIQNQSMKQYYLLFGKEDYLKKQYKEKMVSALIDASDTMNYNVFEGAQTNIQEIIEIGETMPFFSDKRVIVIEDSGLFKKSEEGFEEKLEHFPESTYVIFVEKEVDKRNRLYKWIGKQGYASEMDTPDEKMLLSWIKGLCKAEGKQIEDAAIYYFVEHMGTDMLLLKNELEKLFCYQVDQSVITVDDIKQVCVSQASDKMFEMLDAIGSHNQDKALLLYHDLLALKEPAMKILYMLTRHYNILMLLSGCLSEGKSNKDIAVICKIPPFSVKKYAAQAQRYAYRTLRHMVEQCQDIDQKIKTGKVLDAVGVELLIVEFSSK